MLFITAVDALNNLVAAQAAQRLKAKLKRYLTPAVLVLDELGYLPLDKICADMLFRRSHPNHRRFPRNDKVVFKPPVLGDVHAATRLQATFSSERSGHQNEFSPESIFTFFTN